MADTDKVSTAKVAVVTGASSGIGKEAVRRFLQHGYTVHAAARRMDAMADLAAAGAVLHFLDLTKPESVAAFMADVLAKSGRLDVLVNNAGYGAYGSVEELPMAEARAQMEVNLFGLAELIQLALPTMRAQRSGRILNVTSIGGKIWSPLGAWYHASKFAVEGFSDALRNEVKSFGIDVVVIEPGATKTEWGNIAVESMRKISGNGPYAPLVGSWDKMMKQEAGLVEPSVIVDAIWTAATAKRPRARYVAPFAGRVILLLRWLLSDRAFDWVLGRALGLPA